MLGNPLITEASTDLQGRGRTPKGKHRARAWLLSLMALFMIVGVVLFGAPGVIVELSVLVLGLSLLGASVVRTHGTSLRAGILVFLLLALMTTGILKAELLVNNLPSLNDHSSPWPYPFVAAIAPMAVLIAAFSVRRSSLALTNKVIRVATIGLLAGFLPCLFLMVKGIAD